MESRGSAPTVANITDTVISNEALDLWNTLQQFSVQPRFFRLDPFVGCYIDDKAFEQMTC